MAYQRWSTSAAPGEQRGDAIDEDGLEYQVHDPNDRPDDQHEDDARDRRLAELCAVRPRDLAHLRHDLVVEHHHARNQSGLRSFDGHDYFVSLCKVWRLHRGQYFFHSTRSGWSRLFLSVK